MMIADVSLASRIVEDLQMRHYELLIGGPCLRVVQSPTCGDGGSTSRRRVRWQGDAELVLVEHDGCGELEAKLNEITTCPPLNTVIAFFFN